MQHDYNGTTRYYMIACPDKINEIAVGQFKLFRLGIYQRYLSEQGGIKRLQVAVTQPPWWLEFAFYNH